MRIGSAAMRSQATGGLRRPPGPSLVQLVPIVAAVRPNAAFGVAGEIARRYGDVVNLPVPLPGMRMTLVSHPDHVEHVMVRHHARYLKHESIRELFFDEPMPMPMLNGEEWKRSRRSLNPHFGGQALAAVGDRLTSGVTDRIAAWEVRADTGAPTELQHELGVVVMDGLMRSMFSTSLPAERLEQFVRAINDYDLYVMARSVTYLLPGFVPRPFRARGTAAKQFIVGWLDEFIHRRCELPAPQPDLLDALQAAEFDGSPQVRHSRVRSELFALLLAGVGTTTAALVWAVALLYADPAVLARAAAEVDSLGDAPLRYDNLQQLQYLRCCFDEAQRIQSGILAHIRTATEDDQIGGFDIPAGSQIAVSPYGIHRDVRFWTDPQQFRPSRFLEDPIHRNAFVPYNVGPRKCLGFRLANAEAVLILASILRRYQIRLPAGWQPRHKFMAGTGLPGGLPVVLTRR